MKKKHDGPLPALVGSILAVAVLATILVKDGWLVWAPVILALVVIGSICVRANRR